MHLKRTNITENTLVSSTVGLALAVGLSVGFERLTDRDLMEAIRESISTATKTFVLPQITQKRVFEVIPTEIRKKEIAQNLVDIRTAISGLNTTHNGNSIIREGVASNGTRIKAILKKAPKTERYDPKYLERYYTNARYDKEEILDSVIVKFSEGEIWLINFQNPTSTDFVNSIEISSAPGKRIMNIMTDGNTGNQKETHVTTKRLADIFYTAAENSNTIY